MNHRDKRLKVLTEREIIDIYEFRSFTTTERFDYFSLSSEEESVLELFRGINSRVQFVFALGYFKARKRFFTVDPLSLSADLEFIQRHVLLTHQRITGTISKPTRMKHQSLILELTGYRFCHSPERSDLHARARFLASVHAHPVYLFKELMQDLEKKRVILPGYTVMQDIIAQAIHNKEDGYEQTMKKMLTGGEEDQLQKLLEMEDQLHDLTFLKHDPNPAFSPEFTLVRNPL